MAKQLYCQNLKRLFELLLLNHWNDVEVDLILKIKMSKNVRVRSSKELQKSHFKVMKEKSLREAKCTNLDMYRMKLLLAGIE